MRRGPKGSGLEVDPLRVRQARVEAGLSLADVAGNDVSRTFIHFVEQGRSKPSSAVLRVIARRTGKPMSYFIRDPLATATTDLGLADELTGAARHVRRFVLAKRLTKVEREAMRLLEVALQQGAVLGAAVEQRVGRSGTSERKAV